MIKLILAFALLSAGISSACGQSNYDVSLIPRELMPYASSVVRTQQKIVEVKSLDNVIVTVKKTVTVLNKNGDDNAHIVISYDKDEAIKNIKGVVYNQFGKQITKFSEADFADESVADGYSLFQSERFKDYLPAITEYPYTLSYEYEIRTKQTLGLGGWSPMEQTNESVEKSSLTVVCKPDFKIRYKEINIGGKANITTTHDGEKQYTWEVNNLKAIRDEPYSPYFTNFAPSVELAPEKFSYYGRDGEFTDWNTLGKWVYDKLIAGRQSLPQETIDKIRALTKDITDPKLKARKVYEYMQNKTHYISVQIGIGGIQPFLAADVDQQNYGDCKALVNYNQALLKAVGIDSYYCVVKSGADYNVGMEKDFASMEQGDHIIL